MLRFTKFQMKTMFDNIEVLEGEAKELFYRLATPLKEIGEKDTAVENLNTDNSQIMEEENDSVKVASVLLEERETTPIELAGSDKAEKARKKKETVVSLAAALGVVTIIVIIAIILIPKFLGKNNGNALLYSVKGDRNTSFVVDIGEYMPEFRGFVIDPEGPGNSISKPDLIGKSVVLFAWRSGNPESQNYLRALTQLHSTVLGPKEDKVKFIGLCLDEKKESAIEAIINTNSYKWDHIYDWDDRNDISQRPSVIMRIVETPAIYVFDSLSRLRSKGISPSELSKLLDTL